jgi:hypothetical protein
MQDHHRVGAILVKGYILFGYIALVKFGFDRFIADTSAAKEKYTCKAKKNTTFYMVQNGVEGYRC